MTQALSLLGRRWISSSEIGDRVSQGSLLTQLLASRGMSDPKQIDDFCDAGLHKLHDPYLLPGMHTAAPILARAIERGELVGIFGDYDADGQTASALLSRVIHDLGGRARVHVPHRIDEGYGLNIDALADFKAAGVSLVVTVDCGISNVDEISWAHENGLEVIVTDHHLPPEQLPPAVAIVNPHVSDPSLAAPYPSPELAGCGVALKLAEAVCERLRGDRAIAHRYVDLVAFGTVADVVSLTGENRSLVKSGLDRINRGLSVPGIKALVQMAGISGRVKAGHIAFSLAPQLNAAGRISDPSIGVRLLLADDMDQALPLAQTLHVENEKRRQIEEQVTLQAREKAGAFDLSRVMSLVVDGENWHPGVVGIVASRLVDLYYRPTFVLSIDGRLAKGSGRSIPGFDLYAALSQCSDLLETFGGHAAAAGLTIPVDNIAAFRHRFDDVARSMLTQDDLIPKLHYDAEVPVERFTLEEVSALSVAEPFGVGNPSPVFVCRNVRVQSEAFGKEQKHLRLRIVGAGHGQDMDWVGSAYPQAVAFGQYDTLAPHLSGGPLVDLAVTPEVNEWNGTRRVQLILKDIRIAPAQSGASVQVEDAAREIAASVDELADVVVKDARGQSKERVVQSLLHEGRAVYILCGVRGSGAQTLRRLVQVDPTMADNALVSQGDGQWARQRSVTVAAPPGRAPRVLIVEERATVHLGDMLRNRPTTLVIWEPPLHAGVLLRHIALLRASCPDLEVQLLFDRADLDRLPEIAQRVYPEVEVLRRLFVLIKQFSPVSLSDTDLTRLASEAQRLWGPAIGVETIETALEIFQQLDLMVHNSRGWTMRPNPPKVDLTHAFRYNEGIEIKRSLGRYVDLLRAAGPSEFLQRLIFSMRGT